MTLKHRALALMDAALCLVRKWWRPLVCLGMGGSLLVNGMLIPMATHKPADLTGLAALVVSLTPFAWLRTEEKKAGVSATN
jgi:hypothetical protein